MCSHFGKGMCSHFATPVYKVATHATVYAYTPAVRPPDRPAPPRRTAGVYPEQMSHADPYTALQTVIAPNYGVTLVWPGLIRRVKPGLSS